MVRVSNFAEISIPDWIRGDILSSMIVSGSGHRSPNLLQPMVGFSLPSPSSQSSHDLKPSCCCCLLRRDNGQTFVGTFAHGKR